MTRTLEWLLRGTNAFNMGRFAFFVDQDDKIAGKAIWDKVAAMTGGTTIMHTQAGDDAWEEFVAGWNEAKAEFLTGVR